jgi:hypothetical protein
VAFVACLLVSTGVSAAWSGSGSDSSDFQFQYVVKFVCGQPSDSTRVVSGQQYATAINIMNSDESQNAGLRHKVVSTVSGNSYDWTDDGLGTDKAKEIDCGELLPLDAAFDKGFVIIESDKRLTVTAVYTTEGGIDVEQVKEREKRDSRW